MSPAPSAAPAEHRAAQSPATNRLRPALALALAGALLCWLAAFAAPSPALAQGPPEPDATAWILIDPADGAVLTAHRAEQPTPVASTTKLMTALVAARELGLRRSVEVAPYEAGPVESLVGLERGERISMRDLMLGLLLASGNDAAVTAAVAASGSIGAFVREMNRMARRLGLRETSFRNPVGLDAPGHHSSARDLARLTTELRRRPFFRRALDRERARISVGQRRLTVVNRNRLVHRVGWVDGVKTGFTAGAGNVLIASGRRKGVDLVSVVIGAPSEDGRDEASLELLRWGFGRYRVEPVVERGEGLASVPLSHRSSELTLEAAEGVRLPLRVGEQAVTSIEAPDELSGPVERGEEIGRAVVHAGEGRRVAVALLAADSVGSASIVDRARSAVEESPVVLVGLGVLLLGAAVAGRARLGAARRRRERERARRRRKESRGSENG